MASNYNSRPRAAEVLVDGTEALLARERERYPDLVRGEHLPPRPRPAARRFPGRRG
jgi:diaminopimelate decarboxylase